MTEIIVNRENFLVYPDFRIVSYDKNEFLHNDIALVAVKEAKTVMKSLTMNFNGYNESLESIMDGYRSVSSFSCDKRGLSSSQQCLVKANRQNVTDENLIEGSIFIYADMIKFSCFFYFADEYLEQIQLDPREGYYVTSCLHKSGTPIFTKRCIVQAMILITNCQESFIIALNFQNLKAWILTAIMTDIMKFKKWKKSNVLRKLYHNEMKKFSKCEHFIIPEVSNTLDRKIPNRVIEQEKPRFRPLSENLRVITDCGVEVRAQTGIIHSPIHYKDVKNSKELLNLLQNDYKYRPNQECEWLITAPRRGQKVGIQFKYFDLHPEFDRLEIVEEGKNPTISDARFRGSDVARFRGGESTRTIISGSDQIRLIFYSDYHEERRGFALTFQPVTVTQCGGSYFATAGRIDSPNYPFFYPPDAVCIWKIQARTKI